MRRFLDRLTGPPADYQSIEALAAYRRFDVADEAEQIIALTDESATIHGRHLWASNDRLQITAATSFAALAADTIGDTMLDAFESNAQKPWPALVSPSEYAFIETAYGTAFSYIEASREAAQAEDTHDLTVNRKLLDFSQDFPEWPTTFSRKETFVSSALIAAQKLHVWTSYRVEELNQNALIPNEYRRHVADLRQELAKTNGELTRISTLWQPAQTPSPEILDEAYTAARNSIARILQVGMYAHCPSVLNPEKYGIRRPIVIGVSAPYTAERVQFEIPATPPEPNRYHVSDMRAYAADIVTDSGEPDATEPTLRYNPEVLVIPSSARKAAETIIQRTYAEQLAAEENDSTTPTAPDAHTSLTYAERLAMEHAIELLPESPSDDQQPTNPTSPSFSSYNPDKY